MNLVKRPSEIIAFVEKDIGNGVVNRSTGIPQAMPFDNNWFLNPYRHGANASSWAVAYVGSVGSANYTFVDGHVAALSGDTPGLVSGASLGATRHDSQASIDLLWAAGK